jgi:hypothetical protein
MKLLNRLRELRLDNYVNPLDQFYFSIDHYHDDTIGIGSATVDDILRLNQESNNIDANNLNKK